MEHERKFIVNDTSKIKGKLIKEVEIEQYYLLSEKGKEVRCRKSTTSSVSKFELGMKFGEGRSRFEKEFEISEKEFESIIQFDKSYPIRKLRKTIMFDNHVCEVDFYRDDIGTIKNLVVVEVEFLNEKLMNDFIPFEWFGEEVSDDSTFKNKNLWKLLNKNL